MAMRGPAVHGNGVDASRTVGSGDAAGVAVSFKTSRGFGLAARSHSRRRSRGGLPWERRWSGRGVAALEAGLVQRLRCAA
eukprot:CAMPEP_0195096396 /NCGR_PEP_ID=MMETSP0448-20130528/51526_1 /TAXON_ID=66468 /ORGANISM="Heterocapsa triquestra, Strain CCMP 448" /LENGTH=79 /DNA_ID=CAMNT_0040130769 /DNA_START=9 /DNA_END=245 /DNA_ORIENTATION=-